MMMILRNMCYEEVLNVVRGRNVMIWTCNTCAKICKGAGGADAADRLAVRLGSDGVNVSSSVSVSAACLMSKVNPKVAEMPKEVDMIIALTCDIGVTCASNAFKRDVLAPFATVGYGYADEDGSLILTSCSDADVPASLDRVAEEKGMGIGPLI